MGILSRRRVLQGLGVGAVAALSGCADDPIVPTPPPSPGTATPTAFPFRPGDSLEVEAAVFDGAFGTDYVREAGDALAEQYAGISVTITPVTSVSGELAARFDDGGTPPDLLDNSGPGAFPLASMVDDFEDLTALLLSTSADGTVLGDTLTENATAPGLIGQKQVAINYALSVYGLWHSATRFAAEGWTMPATWDAMLTLGEEARSSDTYLFVYGEDSADYYQELAITSAIKEGGHEVRIALDNLADGAWHHPAVAGVLAQLEACVSEGYVLDGGAGHVAAQAQWSQQDRALLYPAGSWIAREMDGRMAADFEMTVSPVPTLTSSPALPPAAAHLTPTEAFVVPTNSANPEGGKELLRSLLSLPVAENFVRANLTPTVVRSSVPADLTSTALTSQTRVIADAGDAIFTWRFPSYYGLNAQQNVLWNAFFAGRLTAATLAERLQDLSDEAAADPEFERYTVS